MRNRTNAYVFLLVLFALVLRVWDVEKPGFYIADEAMKLPASVNYVKSGHVDPDYFFHPPLRYLLFYANLKVFGDNPYGWRMLSVLAGAITVLILFLLARELFGEKVAFLSAALLAVDPTHISQSRTPIEEIILVLFFLAGFLAAVKYLKGNDTYLILSGFFFGLSLATKLYYFPAVFSLLLIGVIIKSRAHGWKWSLFADISAAFVLLPLTIYILTYYAWFDRGYDFMDFIRMQGDSYRELQTKTVNDFAMGSVAESRPAAWFVKPLISGFRYRSDGVLSEYHMEINNFPIWMSTIPSLMFLLFWLNRHPDRYVGIFVILFAATYLPFFAIQRPMFVYSSLVILPFTLLAVSFFIVFLTTRFLPNGGYFPLIVGVLMLWCLFLYPLVIAKPVPDVIYKPLLSMGRIYNVMR